MRKFLITSFFMLVAATPALAKPKDVYPVPCVDLWAAVKVSLENPQNYGIMSINDAAQSAAFIVVGDLTPYTDRVSLVANEGGCEMKAAFLEVGSDNANWRQFHNRLAKSLAKLQAAKPKPAATATGQL